MEKSKSTTPNIHKGHRKRLTNLVFDVKLENLTEIQQVEYLLTLTHPRIDVNPLAHILLRKFGNFANILDAHYTDLITVKGINAQTAKKIVSFRSIFNLYNLEKLKNKTSVKNYDEFLKKLENLLRFQNTEILYLIALNNRSEITQTRCYELSRVREVGIEPKEIFSFLLSSQPAQLAIAHNHAGGVAIPSDDDYGAVTMILDILEKFDCKLLDSYIIGSDGIYSDFSQAYIKNFDENANIINFSV